jgi:hypothetical protein
MADAQLEEFNRLQNEIAQAEEFARLQKEIEFAEASGKQTEAEPKGLGQKALDILGTIPAATRSAITTGAIAGPLAGAKAGWEQFKSMEPGLAPTGEEQAAMAGLPTKRVAVTEKPVPGTLSESILPSEGLQYETSGAELAGLPAEIAQDPTGALIRAGSMGISGAAKLARPFVQTVGGLAGAGVGSAIEKTTEELGKAAGTVASTISEKAAPIVKAGVAGAGKAITALPETVVERLKAFVPKIRPELESQLRLGQKYGVDPALLTQSREMLFGPEAFVTRVRATSRQMGDVAAQEALAKTQQQVQTAIGEVQRQLSGGVGSIGSEATGKAIRDAYEGAVDNLFKRNSVRYSTIASEIGDKPLTADAAKKIQESTDGLLKRFQEIAIESQRQIKRSVDPNIRGQAAANLDAVNRIIDGLNARDVASTIEQMQQVGRDAFSTQRFFGTGQFSPSKDLLKKLYNDMKNVVTTNLEAVNPAAAEKLKKANEEMSSFFAQNKYIGRIIQDESVPNEKVFENLIMNGQSNNLDALQGIIGKNDEAMNAIKGEFLDAIQRKTADADTIPVSTLKNLNNQKNARIASRLFTPEEIQDFRGMVQMARDVGVLNVNPSGSGLFVSAARGVKTLLGLEGEKQAASALEAMAFERQFQNATIPDLVALKQAGYYPPELLDAAIAKKQAAGMAVKGAARPLGEVLSEVNAAGTSVLKDKTPFSAWDAVSNYTYDVAKELGEGFIPTRLASDRISRIMTILTHSERMNPAEVKPIRVPAEDIDAVKAFIDQSNASPLLKARNKLSLDQTNMLLNPGAFAGAKPILPSAGKPVTGAPGKDEELYKAFRDVMKAKPNPSVEAERPNK